MNDPTDDVCQCVWPPPIAHKLPEEAIVLTKAQLDRIRYRWFHVFTMLTSALAGTGEYFSTSHGWWQSPTYKLTIVGVCLLGFGGNLWRAMQGWHLKATLEKSEK